MHRQVVFACAVALLTGFALAPTAGGWPARPQSPSRVAFRVMRGDPLGDVEEGTVKVLDGGVYELEAGRRYDFPATDNRSSKEGHVHPGCSVTLTLQPGEDGYVRVEMILEYTVTVEEARDRQEFRTVRTRKTAQVWPRRTWRFRLGEPSAREETWLELDVEPEK
jgi:hypothetical protein